MGWRLCGTVALANPFVSTVKGAALSGHFPITVRQKPTRPKTRTQPIQRLRLTQLQHRDPLLWHNRRLRGQACCKGSRTSFRKTLAQPSRKPMIGLRLDGGIQDVLFPRAAASILLETPGQNEQRCPIGLISIGCMVSGGRGRQKLVPHANEQNRRGFDRVGSVGEARAMTKTSPPEIKRVATAL